MGALLDTIELVRRYPKSDPDDITDAYMRGHEDGRRLGRKEMEHRIREDAKNANAIAVLRMYSLLMFVAVQLADMDDEQDARIIAGHMAQLEGIEKAIRDELAKEAEE